MAVSNLDKKLQIAANEELRAIYNTSTHSLTPKRRGPIKKHNCLNLDVSSEDALMDPCLKSNLRRPFHTIPVTQLESAKKSTRVILKLKKNCKSKRKKIPVEANATSNNSEPYIVQDLLDEVDRNEELTSHYSHRSQSTTKSSIDSCAQSHTEDTSKLEFVDSSKDQEYVLFLLRITEDIISEGFYSNNDIKRIIKTHIDLNKYRLNMKKMHFHIAILCRALNIDCNEFQTSPVPEEMFPNKFQNSENDYKFPLSNEAFRSCQDCSVIRTSSLYKMQAALETLNVSSSPTAPILEDNINSENGPSLNSNLLKLLEKLSLSRVPERTESVPSTLTMSSLIPNFSHTINSSRINEQDLEKTPLDFEAFIEELNSKRNLPVAAQSESDLIGLTCFLELDSACKENVTKTELLHSNAEKCNSNLSSLSAIDEICENSKENFSKEKWQKNTSQNEKTKLISKSLTTLKDSHKSPQSRNFKILSLPNSARSNENVNEFNENQAEREHKTEINSSDVIQEEICSADEKVLTQSHEKTTNENSLKVIIEGPIKDQDYVMVKGPIYVYKPLLDSESKLIVLPNDQQPDKLDQGVQYASIHTLEVDSSMDNILKLPKTAYTQYMDVKLLQTDYDLTPEKDESDKYHHLLTAASTSRSDMNLPESLLLSEEYTIGKDIERFNTITGHSLNEYLQFQPKLFESDYIVHTRLNSSASMSKLKLGNNRSTSYPSEGLTTRNENVLLRKYSTDFVRNESQDSSLRSEGEAF
ncbi:hypothetical protein ABEB36_003382 [Hypothenemus hampei]|uniref:Uncharacterized protein n=1 Tax=Hypothenemus hampei TaxID=57062 RepID=A0ABD1FC39_HYPHA